MESHSEASAPEHEQVADQQPVMNTRRSLRQQAKKATQTIHEIQQEEELVDIELSEEEDLARFAPLNTAPRRKRFLKDKGAHRPVGGPPGSGMGRKAPAVPETTAQVLNRLLGKRTNKPGYVVKHGRFNVQRGRPAGRGGGAHARNIPPPPPLQPQPPKRSSAVAPPAALRIPQPMGSFENMPLKVEIQEGHSSMMIPTDGPRKRGRKRKVDMPVNLSMKNEAGELIRPVPLRKLQKQHKKQIQDPDWDPNSESIEQEEQQQQQQRKRGRQSVATAIVKNRFPFCSLCLSKNPPSDYIINYMSCPNEYQRMKRLFTYIYKDLRFPFMPFDMERENVFDYCDLPLCDCCIQLYREIYDSYVQIETARDQLKSKVERMVYQIQLSEQNPSLAQQLSSIKNSPDALMNKYCNFRRRFATYKPGDSRGDVEGANLVPATIARIRVINQTPKRTAGTQTFLTAGHFPPTQPSQETKPATTTTKAETSATPSTSSTAAGVVSSGGSGGAVVIKKEAVSPISSSSLQGSKSDSAASSKITKDQTLQKQTLPKAKPTPSTSTSSSSKPVVATAAFPKPSASSTSKPDRPIPPPTASVLTIVKTPGGGGPAIIRKMPQKPANSIISQHSRLLAIATPTHKKVNLQNPTVNGSTAKSTESTKEQSRAIVKDEPVDPEEIVNPTDEESDPFFSGDPSTETLDGVATSEKDAGKADSTSEKDEDSVQINTNVFHKHKKLRVLPVPSYKDSSNDSSENATANSQEDSATKEASDNNDSENDLTNDKTENQEPEQAKESVAESTTPAAVVQDDSDSISEPAKENAK